MQVAASVLSIDAMATVRVALLLCDTPVSPPVLLPPPSPPLTAPRTTTSSKSPATVRPPPPSAAHTTDHAIYTKWLTDSLATYPDSAIARRTRLQVDPYDVVDKKEYPPAERLQHGAPDAYDCVMLTGSSMSLLPPPPCRADPRRTYRARHSQPLYPASRPIRPLPRLRARVPAPQTHRHLFRPSDPLHRFGRRVRPRAQWLGNWRLRMSVDRGREVLVDRRCKGARRRG